MKIIFLVSGQGGNLKFVNQCMEQGIIRNCSLSVIADRDCGALDYCKEKGIDHYLIEYSKSNNIDLLTLLKKEEADIIITNIHKVLDKEIVENFKGKLINLHYSLLPAYGGLIGETPVEAAMKYSKFVGITLHYVDEVVDSGEVIMQAVVRNEGNKHEILNKIFRMGCFSLLDYFYLKDKNSRPEFKKSYSASNKYLFSPEITFEVDMFTEKFWNELARI